MKTIQSSEAKAKFAELLDTVERGETVLITRHGRPIARITPEQPHRQKEIEEAIADIRALRKTAPSVTIKEILAWRDEGRK